MKLGRLLGNFISRITTDEKNQSGLRELKDIHGGQRGFVIGTGPSLKIEDLDKLKSEITFACNKIYLAFDQTSWRPTYYTVLDKLVAKNNQAAISRLDLKKIFSGGIRRYFPSDRDILWLRDLPSPVVNGVRQFRFSQDIAEGTYGGFTVIYAMLQVAFHMGIREVYLLGIDFSFEISKETGRKTSSDEIILKNSGEMNHFHPGYRTPGELWTMPRLDLQYEAFKVAKASFESAGGTIVNASRRTKLDVFPRADFDSIVSEM